MSVALERVLDLVKRELGAIDARLELGGEPPSDPHLVWTKAGEGARLVAVFDEPPEAPDAARTRLFALVRSFTSTVEKVIETAPLQDVTPGARTKLDETLHALAAAHETAAVALVIDEQSSHVWGQASLRDDDVAVDLEAVAERARAQTEDWCIEQEPLALASRRFATIYRVVIAFDGPFSEMHVRGRVRKALPIIERLVVQLPPLDPTPKGGTVTKLFKPR